MNTNFSKELIQKACFYFHNVFVEIDRIRVYITAWEYAEEYCLHSNSELKKFIDDWEAGLMEDWEGVYTIAELRSEHILY